MVSLFLSSLFHSNRGDKVRNILLVNKTVNRIREENGLVRADIRTVLSVSDIDIGGTGNPRNFPFGIRILSYFLSMLGLFRLKN